MTFAELRSVQRMSLRSEREPLPPERQLDP
jgi:hypothetical protein